SRPGIRRLLALATLLCSLLSGCAALTNPLAEGVPVRRLPPELVPPPRNGQETIPLTLLRQPRPDVYRLAPGDVLGVYIEGILGERTQGIPIQSGPVLLSRDQRRVP